MPCGDGIGPSLGRTEAARGRGRGQSSCAPAASLSAATRRASTSSRSTSSASGTFADDLALHDDEAEPAPPRCRRRPRAPRRARSRRSPSRRPASAPVNPLVSIAAFTCCVSASTSTSARPHDGQATRSRPRATQAERLQDRVADLDLLDRVVGERDADRVADPLGEQRADADGALHPADRHRARLGHARGAAGSRTSRRAVGRPRSSPARSSASREILMSTKSSSSRIRASLRARLDERLGGRRPVLLEEVLLERAGVDADPDRHAREPSPRGRSGAPCPGTGCCPG